MVVLGRFVLLLRRGGFWGWKVVVITRGRAN